MTTPNLTNLARTFYNADDVTPSNRDRVERLHRWLTRLNRDDLTPTEALAEAHQLAIDNLLRLGYTHRTGRVRGSNYHPPPPGGRVFRATETGELIGPTAVVRYGHLDPPCTKCLLPVDDNDIETGDGHCSTCRHAAQQVGGDFIIIEGYGCRRVLKDRGHRPKETDKSLLGFFGTLWNLEPVDPDRHQPVTSNNLFELFTVGRHWFNEYPVTHHRVTDR